MTHGTLEEAINLVNTQLFQVSLHWKIFGQLFDSGQENIDILNRSGATVFQLLQVSLIDEIVMSLSKLTDKSKTGKHENASIQNVVAKARGYLSATTSDEVDSLIKRLELKMKNVRLYRHKALAHSDLQAMKVSAPPRVTYDELEESLKILREIVAQVALAACQLKIPNDYNVIVPFGTGGDELLKVLRRGLR